MKVYFIFGLILGIYYIVTIRLKIPQEIMPPSPYHLTAKMAYPIYCMYMKLREKWIRDGRFSQILQYESRITKTLKTLEPLKDAKFEQRKRLLHKLSMVMLVVVVGTFLACVVGLKSNENQILQDEKKIARTGHMEDEQTYQLEVNYEDGTKALCDVTVSGEEYTKAELEELYVKFCEVLVDTVLQENESTDHVTSNLSLPDSIEGYPFKVQYQIEAPYIDFQGEIDFSQVQEAGAVELVQADIRYGDFQKELDFNIRVEKPNLTREELLAQKLQESLKKSNESTITEEQMELPDSVNGIEITWQEKKEDHGALVMLLFFVVAILLFFAMDKDLLGKKENRKKELLKEYPEVVSKLTLLTGAGLTIRGAMKRIVQDYQNEIQKGKPKRYAFEEIVICVREMESGITELQAYDRLGKRCQTQAYIKLSSLVTQNLRKGTQGFSEALQMEAMLAMEEKKNTAKVQGETITTKILVPMMLMLFLVMIMIMVPAFSSL